MPLPESPHSRGLKRSGSPSGTRRVCIDSIARAAAMRFSRSTRRRRPSAARCTSATSSRHAHRPGRALSADARQGSVLPDGVGRQRPADRAPRAELLRRALRSVAAVRPVVHAAADKPDKQPISVSRPNFIELCDAADGRRREGVRSTCGSYLGLSVDWSMTYATIGKRCAARVAAGVPAAARARPRLSGRGADAVGRGLSNRSRAGRARGSRACPARTTGFVREIGWRRVVEIETTRPELIPACVALVAHPDDARYQPLFGTDVDHAAVRRACAGEGARAGRSRKGQRHRDDLHLRRHHRRDVVARARAAGARGRSSRRHAAAGRSGARRLGIGRRRTRAALLRRARRVCPRRRRARRSSSS